MDKDTDLLRELEEAVFERLTKIEFMVKEMPSLVAYLMAFCAKLHIAMGGTEARFVKLSKDVYKNLYSQKTEIMEEFQDFLKNNTEDAPNAEKDKILMN